ncbi:MAG: hypothetical protein HS114_00705 [Anaerolineales bacterium]|nr:hypothetical protein [Anaerolineales bacterium]
MEGEILQTKADLGEAEAGRIPNENAYKVKDHLNGQVEVLCDLIDSVDREWQPIIERIMGGRRFTLITTETNYNVCLKTFRSLSNEITDGVHLARPKDALPYGEAAAGSLAEKVIARNRIGQGLLNRHLNSLQAYESDDKAVEASVSVATRTGIIVRGGTIQRLTPLPRNKLVFDRVAREEQRKELEAKLKQLLTRRNILDQKLSGLDPLQKKISQQINATKLINPDLAQQEAQFQTDLAALAPQIKVIKEAANFILLEEEKRKADTNFQSITKKCNELEMAITRSQDAMKGLEQNCEEDGRILQSLENQLISFNDIEWQPIYQEVRISSSTTGQDFARFLETEKFRWDNEVVSAKSKLEGQVRDYIAKSSPTLSWRPFQEQLQACLEERQRLQELELKKLIESQQQLRAEAERILKTTFFDALLRAHGEIEKGIRRLNKAIQKVKLGRRSYRFTMELIKTTEVKNVWELVQSYNKLKPEQLGMDFTNQIFDTQRELIDRLLELFVPPEEKLAVEQSQIRRTLLTPVKYFEFDIEATEDGQKWFLLSRQYGKGSGGEHQNPLYILLAGAMLQFYEDHPDRPRFVIIDEAFGKAPFSAVNGLEMLLNEGLQPIVSTVLNQPQVEEVIGYTVHISRPSTDMGKNKKTVHVVTNPKAKLFAK